MCRARTGWRSRLRAEGNRNGHHRRQCIGLRRGAGDAQRRTLEHAFDIQLRLLAGAGRGKHRLLHHEAGDAGTEIGAAGMQGQAEVRNVPLLPSVRADGEVDVFPGQSERLGAARRRAAPCRARAGDQEGVAAELIRVVDAAVHLERGAGGVELHGERPGAGEGGDRAALQPVEGAGVDGDIERDLVRLARDLAAERARSGFGLDFGRGEVGRDRRHVRRVDGDVAAVEANAVQLHLLGVGARRRGGIRITVQRGAGGVELPVRRAVGPVFQQDVRVFERHILDNHFALEQRQQGDLGVQLARGQHVGAGAAGQVGKADIAGGQAGREAERNLDGAVDRKGAAGGALNALLQRDLEPVHVEAAASLIQAATPSTTATAASRSRRKRLAPRVGIRELQSASFTCGGVLPPRGR